MPEGLYDTDILAWSREQADRLRRVAAGERVNDLDWGNVIEEIESVGRSSLQSVLSFLELAFLHGLKVVIWADDPSVRHWTSEIANFLTQAQARFEPGMQQHVDPEVIMRRALGRFTDLSVLHHRDAAPLPEVIDVTAAELRDPAFGVRALLDRIRAALPPA